MRKSKQPKGFFITFEGGEGVGKSTQIELLRANLAKNKIETVTTREPGGTPGAEAIRHVLLSGAAEPIGPNMEALMFSAARADHVDLVIRPALESGKTVLCDRYIDSTRVYQAYTGKVDIAFVLELEEISCGDVRPNLTFILDMEPEEGMKRAKARSADDAPDRFEREDIKLQRRRREAFLEIARQEPERCRVIDASGNQKTVAARIWDEVQSAMQLTANASG